MIILSGNKKIGYSMLLTNYIDVEGDRCELSLEAKEVRAIYRLLRRKYET